MNREIKVKYLYTDGHNWIAKVFTLEEIINGDPFDVLSDSPFAGSKKYKMAGRVLFTGLKDLKDVDIYEGDIVVPENLDDTTPFTIKWRDDLYMIVGDSGHDWLCMEEFIGCEIIGNIYESPLSEG